MYLSKLEILGFKSFAQKTVVHFNHGVTSIVGPNGCGKTNIVDAIRWSLGEQKSSTLRSDKMENVIFNGTSNKKPMGMAEVSLTIENDKGILPSEYTEVVITRRIFRSGESEYLLNRNICRLKDITNLFMDTGMGSNAYSVIELKMVEQILNNKAEERRNMFEEAAGVNKYKLRRRLTLRKLDEVKTDLTRVNDIVSEVDKKVASLERQAKRADRHNKLSITLRELELDLAERELAYFHFQKAEQKAHREANFTKKLQFESDLARLDDELHAVKENLYAVERQLQEKRSAITAQTELIYKAQQTLSVSEERKKSLEINIERYHRDINELQQQLTTTQENIEDYKVNIQEIATRLEEKQAEKEKVSAELQSYEAELETQRQAVKQNTQEVLNLHKELSSRENTFHNLQNTLQRINSSIEVLNKKIQSLTGNIAKTVNYIEELTQEKNESEQRLKEAESFYQQKQDEKSALEQELNTLKEKELEQRGVINVVRDKISFLQNVIESLEGFSKGAKALLEDNSWNGGAKNLIANIGNAGDEFRFAIEAALKNNLNSIIVDTIDDIRSGIEFLEKNDYGKASFYMRGFRTEKKSSFGGSIKNYFFRRRKQKAAKQEGFLGWCDELIVTDDEWKPLFNRLLSTIGIVKDLKTAFALSEQFPEFTYTTLNGDILEASGLVEGGAAPRLDETLFGRRQLLEDLKKQYPKHEAELASLQAKMAGMETRINSIDMKVLADNSKILVNDLANIEKQIAQFEFEKTKAVDEIEKNRHELQEYVHQSNQLDDEREKLEAELLAFRTHVQNIEGEQQKIEESFREVERSYNSVQAKINLIDIEFERLTGEKKNYESGIVRSEDNIVTIKKSLENRNEDITAAASEIETLAEIIDDKYVELAGLNEEKEKLQSEETVIGQQFKEVRSEINEKEAAQGSLRKEREAASNEIHASEMKLNELEIKVENLRAQIAENYSLQIELKEFEDLDTFDFKTRTEEVHSYKQQIKNLGPVNLLAYSEFDEEKQRLEFLHKQRDDLVASEKDLIKTIEEINTTAQNLFLETFGKIREHFINIFRSLFNPGDEADLKLEEDVDPLEGKIEIIAKPKGKRPLTIEALSGGEKTLTAIALLFAIYLVKPSPFCILDEIDAPLDDANIDRFTKIIKQFSANTQFIVVTHNKRTMEAADALYGVTMQEEGISKLVSVKFNEDLNVVA